MDRPEYEGTYPNPSTIYCYDIKDDYHNDEYQDDYDNKNRNNRYTLILKVKLEENIFICNRNSRDYDNIFNDRYVKWWESDLVDIMNFSNIDECEILQILPYDNYKLRHQSLINPIKQEFIQLYNAKCYDDEVLSNIMFNNVKNNYRTKYKIQYKEFIHIIDDMGDNKHKLLYETAKKMYYNKSEKYFLSLSRERIWHTQNRTFETKACYIILRDYLKHRIDNGYNLPFDKNERRINDTIDMLLKINDFNEPRKIRNQLKKELQL